MSLLGKNCFTRVLLPLSYKQNPTRDHRFKVKHFIPGLVRKLRFIFHIFSFYKECHQHTIILHRKITKNLGLFVGSDLSKLGHKFPGLFFFTSEHFGYRSRNLLCSKLARPIFNTVILISKLKIDFILTKKIHYLKK